MARQLQEDTMMEIMMMEIMVSCRWQRSWCPEDGDQRSIMILAISCHYLIACDVYHVFASYLLRMTVVNKMIPHNNFKKVFSLSMHHCESSSRRDTTWWSGVISSTFKYNGCKTVLHTQNTRVKLGKIWPRNTESERSSVNHIVDMINIVMFTIENYSISRDDRTWFSWFGSRDHLDD